MISIHSLHFHTKQIFKKSEETNTQKKKKVETDRHGVWLMVRREIKIWETKAFTKSERVSGKQSLQIDGYIRFVANFKGGSLNSILRGQFYCDFWQSLLWLDYIVVHKFIYKGIQWRNCTIRIKVFKKNQKKMVVADCVFALI